MSLASELAALSPEHYWLMDDDDTQYTDSGNGTAANLTPEVPDSVIYRNVGAVRGSPRVGGTWIHFGNGNRTQGVWDVASGPSALNWDTGAIGAFIILWDNFGSSEFAIWEAQYASGAHAARLMVTTDLRLRLELNGDVVYTVESAAGAVSEGVRHSVCAIQRGDGNGIRLTLDEVDVTLTQSPGGSIDDWFDECFTSTTVCSKMALGDQDSGGTNHPVAIISAPYTLRNNEPAADQTIFDLYAAAGMDDAKTAASDYMEYMLDHFGDEILWLGHSVEQSGLLAFTAHGHVGYNSNADLTSRTAVAGFEDDDQVVSEYQKRMVNWTATGQPTGYIDNTALIGGPTVSVGTLSILMRTGALAQADQVVFAAGLSNGGATVAAIEISVDQEFLGAGTLLFKFWDGPSGSVETLWRPAFKTIPVNSDLFMFTIVQDGADFTFYIDGEAVSGDYVTDTAPRTNWFDTIAASASGTTYFKIGRDWIETAATDFGGYVNHVGVSGVAMSAADVAAMWDAVNGIFPAAQPPPQFVTDLETTGNGGAGPDWWWRMNAGGAPILDVGSAQDMAGPNADSIATGGAPLFDVTGPFSPSFTDSRAVYFDGLGDYFEIGVAGVSGQLLNPSTGTLGFFFSRNALEDENIVFAIGNDAYTQFFQIGLNDDRLELIVQTSAGNRVTYTSSVTLSGAFALIFITCDGTNYRFYIDGPEDTDATLVAIGIGAEGDWLDLITADQTAVAARADVAFTTETTGRISELFLYDGEVLSAATIASLTETAIADGLLGAPSATAVVTFENVTFKNGALADIRAESTGIAAQQQFVRANQCKFIGGQQGDGIGQPQIALLTGPVIGQFRGCSADLQTANNGFGRGGIVGTAVNTALSATSDGSILVSDCDFDGIGLVDGSDFLAAVMCLAAFGMTVEGSRFRNSFGSALGWRADAQRLALIDNQIKGTVSSIGAIHAAAGLNARLGNGWLIRGNKVIDTDGNAIDLDGVTSAGGTNYARNILILDNETDNNTAGIGMRLNQLGDFIAEGNKHNRCTEGIRLGAITDAVAVRRNQITENSATAIICSEGSTQLADLVVDRNIIDGGAALGDGITLVNLRSYHVLNNKLRSLDLGIQLGAIGVEGYLDGNQVDDVATPFALLSPPITGLTISTQQIQDLGNANVLDATGVSAITVQAHHHAVNNTGGAQNIDTIDGPAVAGWLLVLRRAPFSTDMTFRDGIDNLELGSDFLMDADNDQLWLVRDTATGNWLQVDRFTA